MTEDKIEAIIQAVIKPSMAMTANWLELIANELIENRDIEATVKQLNKAAKRIRQEYRISTKKENVK